MLSVLFLYVFPALDEKRLTALIDHKRVQRRTTTVRYSTDRWAVSSQFHHRDKKKNIFHSEAPRGERDITRFSCLHISVDTYLHANASSVLPPPVYR